MLDSALQSSIPYFNINCSTWMIGGIISQFDDFSIKFVGQNGFGNTTDFMPDEIAIRQLTKKS